MMMTTLSIGNKLPKQIMGEWYATFSRYVFVVQQKILRGTSLKVLFPVTLGLRLPRYGLAMGQVTVSSNAREGPVEKEPIRLLPQVGIFRSWPSLKFVAAPSGLKVTVVVHLPSDLESTFVQTSREIADYYSID